jgi:flagellar hook protein FlgE
MSILDSALAGMNSSINGMAVVANNIANVATNGYRAQRYDAATQSVQPRHADAVSASPSGDGDAQPSDVDLVTEFVELRTFETGLRTNAIMAKVADRMQGTMLDIFA